MKTVFFSVNGMTCDHCATTARKALEAVPGVAGATVSFEKGGGSAEIDESVGVATLREALGRFGYGLTERSAGGPDSAGLPETLHVAIIGSGSAAFAAALRAVERGARVTMIEEGTLGGTCVNVGCIPSKVLVRQAHLWHRATHPPFQGLPVPSVPSGPLDREPLLLEQQGLVQELREAKYRHHLDSHPDIRLLRGKASLAGPKTLHVASPDGTRIPVEADRILIATGSRPSVPGISGLAETPFWTSTEALDRKTLPKRLLVLGGGFVALEIGQAFARLGSRVTIIDRNDRLLHRTDPEIGEGLKGFLEGEGLTVLLSTRITRVRFEGEFVLERSGLPPLSGEALLVATGRRPNTEFLDSGEPGIERDGSGAIRVNDRLETSVPGIYAAGDCTTFPKFVYVAAASGTRAAVFMTGGEESDLDGPPPGVRFVEPLPEVIFTDPQVATVGMTEARAGEAGISATVRTLPLAQVPRALANFDTRGFIKIVAENGTGRILGVQILAPEAGEVIQSAGLAIRAGMTVSDLSSMLFPYLTMVEGLKLCAQSFSRDVANLSCCAG